jgi:hypothetical protein
MYHIHVSSTWTHICVNFMYVVHTWDDVAPYVCDVHMYDDVHTCIIFVHMYSMKYNMCNVCIF